MAGWVAETKINKLKGAGEMEDVHVCIYNEAVFIIITERAGYFEMSGT